jgi:hypothetical protein
MPTWMRSGQLLSRAITTWRSDASATHPRCSLDGHGAAADGPIADPLLVSGLSPFDTTRLARS